MIPPSVLNEEWVAARDRRTREPGFFKDPAKVKSRGFQNDTKPTPDRRVSCRVFPNGEFGVGFIPHRGISAQDRTYEHDRRYAENNAYMDADIQICADMPEGFKYTRTKVYPLPPKLGLGAKSSQPSKRYGLKGITAYGRKMLRNAGTVMDKAVAGQYNRRMCMGTLTVPSYSPESMKNICVNWGDITRRFFQECRRRYDRFRYRFDYASATEIQPKRLEHRSEVGLHIHFLHISIRLGRGKWVLPHSWVRSTWGRILADYLVNNEKEQLPNYRHDVVSVSSAAYIAKYVSKGGGDIQGVIEQFGEDFLPRQWWSVSTVVRKCIHGNTVRSQGHLAEMLLCVCTNGMEEYYRYLRKVKIDVPPTQYAEVHNCPSEILLGFGGLLSGDGKSLFLPRNQSESIRGYLPRTLDTK